MAGSGRVPEGDLLRSGRPGAQKTAESEFLFRCYSNPYFGLGVARSSEVTRRATSGPMQRPPAALPVQPGGEIPRRTSLKTLYCN